ncbi:hypothetical protein BDV93DRAFT_361879 [Ceratobasidium sp. AG-I]|nr:hypothetical protein BDV93DRAFT_361879 [Ceratobasidium sp. AG-I]
MILKQYSITQAGTPARPLESKISIKCVYLKYGGYVNLQHSGVDQVSSDFPSTIENMLYLNGDNAYVVQRDLRGQIRRKEIWYTDSDTPAVRLGWLVLQTRHILDYGSNDPTRPNGPSELLERFAQPQTLSTTTHLNCTSRNGGLPCDGTIPTGGQLTRILKVKWRNSEKQRGKYLVWSFQSFVEGGYDDVCNSRLVGQRPL